MNERLPRGVKAQVMGTRCFDTMYTAEQLRKAIADEREACAKLCESHVSYPSRLYFAAAIRARGNP